MADENSTEVKEKSGFDFKIVLIGLLIFLVAMGASYFLMKSVMAPLMPKAEETSKEAETSGGLISAGVFTTNIDDSAGNRYVKVEVSLQVSDEKNAEAETAKEYMPIVRDTIITLLSSKTVADLDDRNALKEEMKTDLNKKLGKDFIKNVYFTDFIMQ